MYKLIGLAVLFITSICIGQTMIFTYKTSVKQIESFIQFIKYIKSQVEYYNMPYPDIFDKYSNPTLEKCGFINTLRTSGWKIAIDNSIFYFNSNIKELLSNFGNELGKSMKQDQIINCTYTIEQLEIQYQNAKSELPKRTKLYNSLSLMAGISIIIILI